jgi:hypothetical protein
MKTTIEIIVDAKGKVTVDALGFQGTGCEAATKFIEAALGEVQANTRKPEFHQTRQAGVQQKAGV